MHPEKIETYVFDGAGKGPTLLVLGAIHGNEKCGSVALARIAAELKSRIFAIEQGRLVLAPVCNPEAYRQNKRMIEANLNRIIRFHAHTTLYEHGLANQVMALIDAADIVLDLHSYASGTRPFLFLDTDTPDNRAFAAALGIPYWVTGWREAYAAAVKDSLNDGDTVSYAEAQKKTALLVECGAHADPVAADVAYHAVRRALAHLGMAAFPQTEKPVTPQVNRLTAVIAKEKPGRFSRNWQHLDSVRKGETLAIYDDGDNISAAEDGVVILPKSTAEPGDEWFYLGTGKGF